VVLNSLCISYSNWGRENVCLFSSDKGKNIGKKKETLKLGLLD